jgi:hypothetical protein
MRTPADILTVCARCWAQLETTVRLNKSFTKLTEFNDFSEVRRPCRRLYRERGAARGRGARERGREGEREISSR